jgi:UPF0755 protein
MIRALIVLFMLIATAAGSAAYWAQDWWHATVKLPSPVEFEVREGATLQSVSNELVRLKVIDAPAKLFEIGWRLTLPKATVKAGDYRLENSLSPKRIASILASGQTVTITFTIPEGWNTFQIAERLEKVFPKTNKKKWLEYMRDPKLLATVPTKPTSVEGFLFPETYTFNPRTAPHEVLKTMVETFLKSVPTDLLEKGAARKLNPFEIVTLASIIEKETGKPEERRHISSVFHNRLRIGMRLQTDPTIIYGIWERYDGNIRKSDLREPTPYNTYVIPRLPPGPIASPGLLALEAAVDPLETEDLYFVSRGDGSHIFSSNLKDHERSVYQYQILPSRRGASRN